MLYPSFSATGQPLYQVPPAPAQASCLCTKKSHNADYFVKAIQGLNQQFSAQAYGEQLARISEFVKTIRGLVHELKEEIPTSNARASIFVQISGIKGFPKHVNLCLLATAQFGQVKYDEFKTNIGEAGRVAFNLLCLGESELHSSLIQMEVVPHSELGVPILMQAPPVEPLRLLPSAPTQTSAVPNDAPLNPSGDRVAQAYSDGVSAVYAMAAQTQQQISLLEGETGRKKAQKNVEQMVEAQAMLDALLTRVAVKEYRDATRSLKDQQDRTQAALEARTQVYTETQIQ